jgi:hypothetical protein
VVPLGGSCGLPLNNLANEKVDLGLLGFLFFVPQFLTAVAWGIPKIGCEIFWG